MNLKRIISYRDAPHIGVIVRHILAAPHIDVTIVEAAKLLDVARPHFNNLINGKADLSERMAFRIEQVFMFEAEAMLIYQAKWRYRKFLEKNTFSPRRRQP